MKIVVDIDEVVADFHGVFIPYFNLKYGRDICLEDVVDYRSPVFGEGGLDVGRVFREFFDSRDFEKMELVGGAFEGVSYLDDNFDIVFVTARAEYLRDRTLDFFKRFFPDRDFEVLFVGDRDFYGSKFDVCEKIGCDLIIEDKGETCLEFAERGVCSILIDRPWNRSFEHELIFRCFSWDEVLERVRGFLDE